MSKGPHCKVSNFIRAKVPSYPKRKLGRVKHNKTHTLCGGNCQRKRERERENEWKITSSFP